MVRELSCRVGKPIKTLAEAGIFIARIFQYRSELTVLRIK